MSTIDTSIFYNVLRVLSHNALFNFIVGARGCGKTYSSKKHAINRYLKTGKLFIYMRRFKVEFKDNDKFFNDMLSEFPDHTFAVKGRTYYIDGKICGYAVVLSEGIMKKGIPFHLCDLIIFDEFILNLKSYYRYLPDEVVNFLEMYETIARLRYVQVLFISNALSFANPYFDYFKVKLPYKKEFYRNGDILVQMVDSTEYGKVKKETRFAKLIEGTEYAKYSIDNDFLLDSDAFIDKKTQFSEYYFTMVVYDKTYGVWIDYRYGQITVSKDVDQTYKIVYAFTTPDHRENTLIANAKDKKIVTFKQQFAEGNVRFETLQIKADVLKILGNRRHI